MSEMSAEQQGSLCHGLGSVLQVLAAADLPRHGGTCWVAQDTSVSTPGRLKSAPAVLLGFSKPQSHRIPGWFVLEGASKLISNLLSRAGTPSPR